MDDGAALLKSILTQPAEDTPRLVYADWLDERGQYGDAERAEFIRVQVKLGAWGREKAERLNDETDWSQCTGTAASWCPNCGDCCCKNREDSMNDDDCPLHSAASNHCCLDTAFYKGSRLRDRERELCGMMVPRHVPGKNYVARRTMGRAYFSECGEVLSGYSLERGFLNLVSLPLDRFMASAEAIFRSHPVTSVRLTDREPDVEHMTDGDPARVWVREVRFALGNDLDMGASILPQELFDLLPGDKTGGIWVAPTETDAYAALSTVCVSYGRSLAELPPLPASGAAHFS